MTAPAPADWPPPAPIRTARLALRTSEARDRAAFVELFSSPEVGAHTGGTRPREELERMMPEVPGRHPGCFVVELDGAMIGLVTLGPPTGDHPAPGTTELGYLFLPHAWGRGYAAEACAAALDWCAVARPAETVQLTTQVANTRALRLARKLGFTEAERFEAYGAEQWLGVRRGPGGAPMEKP
ncbi:GNAT family N-acetyltransferase [Streptomyces sp. NPDC094032]|uniref:GNAT family N-acetyltransferase n=1 Tax=Streptomyces sp. NPDC094032 TaxID=3155308 RepID=UPI0033211981